MAKGADALVFRELLMSRLPVLAASFLLALTCPGLARPQGVSRPRSVLNTSELGMGVVPEDYALFVVFLRPEVQKELKVTDSQKSRFAELQKEQSRALALIDEEYEAKKKALPDSTDRLAVQTLRRERTRLTDSVLADQDEIVRKVLDRRQFARLNEIRLQTEGPAAFNRPEVQEQLNLGPEQVELIGSIVRDGRKMLVALRAPSDVLPDPRPLNPTQRKAAREAKAYKDAVKAARERAIAIRGSTMQSIARVLTKGQRAQYEKMVGAPFDFRQLWTRAPGDVPESEPSTAKKAQ
jgi:hypothetical protein